MGYLIARAMRCYGMPYREVMGMPIRAFWMISGLVERLLADEAKLKLEIAAAAQDGKAAQALFARLEKEAPTPVVLTGYAMLKGAKQDEHGIARLAALAG